MERSIELINIKLHEKTFMDFSGGQMFAFIGKNGSGKSTIIQCLESIALVDNTITDPIQRGKESGKVIRKGLDRDGNPITVEWDITETQSIFRASYLDKSGNTKIISDPKRIRELLGSYSALTVAEVYEMLKYAEGRRKFVKDVLYACLTVDQRVKIADLDRSVSDKKNKETEGNLYFRRATINKTIEEKNSVLRNTVVTEEEKKEIALIPTMEKQLADLRKKQTERATYEASIKELKARIGAADEIIRKISEFSDAVGFDADLPDIAQMLEFFGNTKNAINEDIKGFEKLLEDDPNVLATRIETGDKKISSARIYQGRLDQRNLALQELEQVNKSLEDLNSQIEKAKQEKMEIIKNSSLPAGLSFDEENITLNGFALDESSVSETEARLAIMDLLCSITTSDFVNIGDWSLYDKESRKKIMEISKKSNRMVFGQLVTDDENVDCKIIVGE